jgi:hypothetical protein
MAAHNQVIFVAGKSQRLHHKLNLCSACQSLSYGTQNTKSRVEIGRVTAAQQSHKMDVFRAKQVCQC